MRRIALILCTFVIAQASSSVAWGGLVLKVATLSPDGTGVTEAFHGADKEIQQRTAGRVKLKIYPGGVMGNDATVLKKMRAGQIHGSTFTAGGLAAESSNYQILSLPMLFRTYQEVDAARAKMEPKLNKALEEKGFISMGIVEAGFVYMMSSVPLRGPADLKGRKVWIPEGDPIGRRVFEGVGVPPVQLPLPDVLTGLQTGLIDTVANSPVGTLVLQWFTKVKYLTESPLIYGYGTCAFAQSAWNKIAEQDRPVVMEVLKAHLRKLDQTNRKETEKAVEALKKQGIQFVTISGEALPEMQSIADKASDSLVKEGRFDAADLAEIRAIVTSVRQGK